MSAPTTGPVAGPLFRHAAAVDPGGRTRKRLLALVAAYADGGYPNPKVSEIAERLGLHRSAVAAMLDRLELDGWLIIHREGPHKWSRVTRYELRLPRGDGR